MKVTLLTGMLAFLVSVTASAQQPSTGGMNTATGKLGKMTVAEFNRINTKGNQMVAAIKPTKTALSDADQQLMMQVVAGGQRQLALSQAVLDKVTNPQVRLLAASEVEEQRGVAAKLTEIASAKGITMPAPADTTAQSINNSIQNLSGSDLDTYYLNEGGIRGHELLEQTMLTVSQSAKDESLKKLAAATLPVIRTHLTVSRDVKGMMGNATGTQPTK